MRRLRRQRRPQGPKGQYPDDHNHGYECDKNHGIGRTNPAHSGCHSTTTMPQHDVDDDVQGRR